MPGDTTESREPMLEQARKSLACVADIPANYDDQIRRLQYVQEAQAEATLAVAEELRALREAVNGSAQCVADEVSRVARAVTP